jgi:UDP-N-acetylglucosamine transferase subunit ALG13
LGVDPVIFVTVGQMLGFDRLVEAMDLWAKAHPEREVFAQIGDGRYAPTAMPWTRMIPPVEFKSKVAAAELIVAHAGMGSYFIAMEAQKPIVMLARLEARQEHTTDHQVHTLKWLRLKPGVYAADNEDQLPGQIERALADATVFYSFSRSAPAAFVAKLRQAILS